SRRSAVTPLRYQRRLDLAAPGGREARRPRVIGASEVRMTHRAATSFSSPPSSSPRRPHLLRVAARPPGIEPRSCDSSLARDARTGPDACQEKTCNGLGSDGPPAPRSCGLTGVRVMEPPGAAKA